MKYQNRSYPVSRVLVERVFIHLQHTTNSGDDSHKVCIIDLGYLHLDFKAMATTQVRIEEELNGEHMQLVRYP
jgi:hypothetical protein